MAAWVALADWFRRATFKAIGSLGQYNLVAPVIPDGGGALLQLDASGNLRVAPGAGVWPFYAEDSPNASGSLGDFVLGVRNDAQAVVTSDDRDYSELSVTSRGALYVQLASASGGPVYAEDSASLDAELGMLTLRVRRDAVVSSAGSDGDHVWGNQDADGFDYVRDKAYDAASAALRSLPVTDLSAKRTAGDAPVLLATAQAFVATFATAGTDLGPEIPTMGYTRISLWVKMTAGTTVNPRFRCLVKHTAAGVDEYTLPIYKPNTGATPFNLQAESEYVEWNVDPAADTWFMLTWDVSNSVPYVQFQECAETTGTSTITAYVTYGWGT